ncbi:phage portal protein [Acidothermaceae bacterium B102]|nr:phage portal protein [Acidothermaceae bacterium B102]
MAWLTRFEKRFVSYQDFWGKDYESSVNIDATGLMYYGNRTFAGINITQDRALRMTAVWACVSLIADTIAATPLEAHRLTPGVTTPITVPAWLAKPNTEITTFDFWHRVLTSLLLDGNSYCYISREGSKIIELTPIHPARVWPQRNPNTHAIEFLIDHEWAASADDMLHVPAFTRAGDLRGMSPIEAAKEAIGLGLVTEEFGSRFFGQGSVMSGIITTPNNLEPDAAEIMRRSFSEKHQGSKKAHLPGVLTGGAQWTPLSIPNNDAQFLETRQYQTEEIARIYRVPLHLIQSLDKGTSWGTGIEEQNSAFAMHTLRPWLARIENAVSELMPGPQRAKFNLDDLLRGKKLDRFQAYQIGLMNGIYSKDEVRAMEDLPPIPDGSGSVYLQPLNLGPSGGDPGAALPNNTPTDVIDPAADYLGDPNDPNANGSNP